MTAEGLVAGPRGRGLCLAVARVLSEDVPEAHEFQYAEEVPDPDGTVADLATALDRVDTAPLADLTAPDALVRPVQVSVDAAMYWQEPWLHDQLLARPELRELLLRIAEAVVTSPGASWWSSSVDLDSQHQVHEVWKETPEPLPSLVGVRDRVRRAADRRRDREVDAVRERPRDPRAPWSGAWWSTPAEGSPPTTSRAHAGVPVGLSWAEDVGSHPMAARAVEATRPPRVLELDDPVDWATLVRAHPLDVTASARHDWWRVTGLDVRWAMPDWAAVADEWDAVHLTVTGYLTTATCAHHVSDDVHTVLAGWAPDETVWLADILAATGDTTLWTCGEDDVWRPRR